MLFPLTFPLLVLSTLLFTLSLSAVTSPDSQPSYTPPTSADILITPLTNRQNKGYYLVMQIGETSRNNLLEMLIDISNPWTWVPDIDCKDCFRTNLHSMYYDCGLNPETCYQNQSQGLMNLTYPFGSVLAIAGRDQITFKGLPMNASVNHTLSFAFRVTSDFYGMEADGIFGLGFQKLNATKNKGVSLVTLMYNQGLIPTRSFALFLTNNLQGEDDESQIVFGGYNPEKVALGATFQVSSIVNKKYWALGLNGIWFGTAFLKIGSVNVLTSTTFPDIGVPDENLTNIVSTLEESLGIQCIKTSLHANYICPCEKGDLSKYPSMELELKDVILTVPNFVYMSILGTDLGDQESFFVKKYDNCLLRFRSIDNETENGWMEGKWIFGRTIMSYYHTIFDFENESIGFAVANSPTMYENFSFEAIFWMTGLVFVFMVIGLFFMIFRFARVKGSTSNQVEDEIKRSPSYRAF